MIAITAIDGVLRIKAEVKIPNAENGQWSSGRIGKLIETIQNTVEAAEIVDGENYGRVNNSESNIFNRRMQLQRIYSGARR